MPLLVLSGKESGTCHHHNEHVECIFVVHWLACEHGICNAVHDLLFEYLEPIFWTPLLLCNLLVVLNLNFVVLFICCVELQEGFFKAGIRLADGDDSISSLVFYW